MIRKDNERIEGGYDLVQHIVGSTKIEAVNIIVDFVQVFDGFPDEEQIPSGNRPLPCSCAFFKQATGLSPIDELNLATGNVVVAAIEHIPQAFNLIEVAGDCVFDQFADGTTGIGRPLFHLRGQHGFESQFHI